MKKNIQVSVIIPTYNQEYYIEKCINSGLNQSYNNYEILLIDDGSTDKTLEIIQKYKNNIRILSKQNGGTSSCWNYALNFVKSKYVIGLDSDDEFVYTTIDKVINTAMKNPKIDIIYSDYEFIDCNSISTKVVRNPEPNNPIKQLLDLHNKLGQSNNFVPFGHVRLYKTESLIEAGGYNENYLYAEDYELLLRMAIKGYNFARVPEILYRYRWHETNKGIVTRKEQIEEVKKSVLFYIKP